MQELTIGDKTLDDSLIILDEDRLCYGLMGLRGQSHLDL